MANIIWLKASRLPAVFRWLLKSPKNETVLFENLDGYGSDTRLRGVDLYSVEILSLLIF